MTSPHGWRISYSPVPSGLATARSSVRLLRECRHSLGALRRLADKPSDLRRGVSLVLIASCEITPGSPLPSHRRERVASSSRSQRAMWPTTTLTLPDLPRTVRGRPLASAGVCGGCYSFSYSPAKGRGGVATGLGHQPRTGLAMPDVVRRFVERRAAQLVVAAAAGDQEMTHTLGASAAAPRAGEQMHGFHL